MYDISLEKSQRGYNFASNLTSIKVLHKKFWPSKMPRVSISGISRFPTWSLGENGIWMQPLLLITNNIIRGKMVASFKSGPW